MNHWFLAPETFARMEAAYRNADVAALIAAEEARAHEAEARSEAAPAGLSIVRGSAEIRVEGVLTKKPDWFARFFGGGNTAYSDVRRALATAASDPTVKTVTLAIDSPGGAVDGLFELLDAIGTMRASSGKTLRVKAENALSAAYAIAAAAGNIEAVSRGALFGSVGTVVSFFVSPNLVQVTNTESPNKRPDVTTEEGKAEVRKFLDQFHDELVRSIAKGRGTSAKTVTETFGRGASFTAPNALALGMVDRISTPPRAVSNKGKAMADENEDARASAASIEAAVQRGVTQERDRVLAHLTMGESCGAMSVALEAVRAGTGMTMELNARYITAGINRADRSTRQTESNATTAVVDAAGTAPAGKAPDLGDQVVTILKGNAEGSFVRG